MQQSRPSSRRLTPSIPNCWMSSSGWSSHAGDRKMERESLLTVLMLLLGGMALQFIAAGLSAHSRSTRFFEPERMAWFRLLRPLIPALLVAACLCGWALSQPDPVPDRVGPLVFVVCAPFGLIGVRAMLR